MKYVAITQRVQVLADIQERRDALSQEWASLFAMCDLVPIVLPNVLSVVKELLHGLPIGGIVFSGGNDLVNYGGDAPERDEVEHFLVEYALENQIPLLGICRGMQLILDHFGTPLHPVQNHVRVHHILNSGSVVNSFHSYGATSCMTPLEAIYWSQDGVLEAVRHTQFPWIRGIMWHPEREHPPKEQDIAMIKELFNR